VDAQALSDIRVLDLTRLLPGGLCTLLLADLGADVIKIEQPVTGDHARARAPHLPGGDSTSNSASFRGVNRNKRSVVIDLKAPGGPDALLAMAATADVVVESFRPGVLDRLGIGYDRLRAVNPEIVLCQISGWGQGGPLSQAAGHDLNYLAAMGLLSPTGRVDDPPALIPMQVADSASGLFAAASILAALHERRRSGRGQRVDVSIAHCALTLASMSVAGALGTRDPRPAAEGVWSGGAVCYQLYRCEDGWVALGALEEKFWTNWCLGVQRPDLIGNGYEAPHSETHKEVIRIMAGRTRAEWRQFASVHDCCLTVVSGLAEALDSELVRERGTVQRLPHPGEDDGYEALAHPVLFSRTPPDHTRLPAPALGTDSEAVLKECGIPVEVVRRLRAVNEIR
jgi:crotonobetainyl-CoA:carnitine CoA-transferase CaiB-like acyl-CoA transferase